MTAEAIPLPWPFARLESITIQAPSSLEAEAAVTTDSHEVSRPYSAKRIESTYPGITSPSTFRLQVFSTS
jgi:hypothetical protein